MNQSKHKAFEAPSGAFELSADIPLRNSPDYDDWEYGTEPLPGDTTWTSPKTMTKKLQWAPTEEQNCSSCYYSRGSVSFLYCHRNAPIYQGPTIVNGKWPGVDASDWCGEWADKQWAKS